MARDGTSGGITGGVGPRVGGGVAMLVEVGGEGGGEECLRQPRMRVDGEVGGIRSKSRGRARSEREVNSGTKSRTKKKKCHRGGATGRPLGGASGASVKRGFQLSGSSSRPVFQVTIPYFHSRYSSMPKGSAER
jgi:hypothetical protein